MVEIFHVKNLFQNTVFFCVYSIYILFIMKAIRILRIYVFIS